MNKRTIAVGLLCSATLLALTGTLQAQEDHLIENQRYVVGIDDFSWGDTYVGKFTSDNGLIITNYISNGETNEIQLTVNSLTIGSESNFNNFAYIGEGGELQIEGDFIVLGTNNANRLLIDDLGTLFVKSDFDASMGGFYYNSGANLKVGGEVSDLDNVEGGLNFTLTGENASWSFGTDILNIGTTSDANSVTLTENAQIDIDNLSIGAAGTTSNSFLITDGSRATIQSNITIQGSGSSLTVTNGGWLEVGMDFTNSMAGFELQTGGGLEAHRNLVMDSISNGVYVVLDGTNAVWDRTGLAMDIGSSTNNSGNSLTVRDGAQAYADQLNLGAFSSENLLTITNNGIVAVNQIIIGATNTQDNSVLITSGGNLILEGSGSFINATNSLTLVEGGKLTVKTNFWDAIDWTTNANFTWGNGGILEIQGAAPVFTSTEIDNEYIEYGSLFLQRGQILILNGSNATWNAAAHNLHVGDLSHGNALIVTNGGYAEVKSMTIGDFREGGHDNYALITGSGSEIYSQDGAGVGAWHDLGVWHTDGGSNNTLRIENGGKLLTDGDFYLGGYRNSLSIDGAASQLSVAGAMIFAGTQQHIELSNGGVLTNDVISINGNESTVLINGTGSLLGTSENLAINGTDLTLEVTNGGTLTNGSAFSMTGDGNTLLLDGNDSLLSSTGDMTLTGSNLYAGVFDGSEINAGGALSVIGTNNYVFVSNSLVDVTGDIALDGTTLAVFEGGNIVSGGTLYNMNTAGPSEIWLDHGASITNANYYQEAGAILSFGVGSTPTNLGILVVDNTAEFETGAKLVLYGSLTNLAMNTTYTNTLVDADNLIVGGQTNAVSADLALLDTTGSSSLINFLLYVEDQDIRAILNRISLAQSAGFSEGSMMWDIANEIDRLSLNGNSAAANQIDILNGINGSQQHSELNQLYAYQMPTYMHNQGVFSGIDQVRARGSSFHGDAAPQKLPQPTGVKGPGPHAADQGLQGWAKVYGSFGSRDKEDFNDGYDARTYGTVLGLDQAFDQWLFGIAGGYAGSTLDGDNGDESEATTGYGMLYASYGTKEWFGDLVVSYGLSDIENTSGGAFDVESNTDASQTAFYIGGGREFKDPDGSDALLRPLLALQISQYDQDGYTEKSSNAVAKDVDGYDRWSYQSIFGAELVFPAEGSKVDIETQLRAYWLHEFNDDKEKVGYTLVGSTQPGEFVMRAPESDVAQFGVGCVAKWDNGLQLRADVDFQAGGDFFGTTLSGALLYEF